MPTALLRRIGHRLVWGSLCGAALAAPATLLLWPTDSASAVEPASTATEPPEPRRLALPTPSAQTPSVPPGRLIPVVAPRVVDPTAEPRPTTRPARRTPVAPPAPRGNRSPAATAIEVRNSLPQGASPYQRPQLRSAPGVITQTQAASPPALPPVVLPDAALPEGDSLDLTPAAPTSNPNPAAPQAGTAAPKPVVAPVPERLVLPLSEQPKPALVAPVEEEMPLLDEPAVDIGESLDLDEPAAPPKALPTPAAVAPQPATAPEVPLALPRLDAPDATPAATPKPAVPSAPPIDAPEVLPLPKPAETAAKPELPAQSSQTPARVATPPIVTPPVATPPVAPVIKPAPAAPAAPLTAPKITVEPGGLAFPEPIRGPAAVKPPSTLAKPEAAAPKTESAPPAAAPPTAAPPAAAAPTLSPAAEPATKPAAEPALPRLDVTEPSDAAATPSSAPKEPATPAATAPQSTPETTPAAPAVAPAAAAPTSSPQNNPAALPAPGTPVAKSGPKPVPGLTAPPGFEVTEYASDALAHDVYAMTVDSHGRVVVAGPGYIRILIDSNNDGRADRARTFSTLPANGAQGLCFVGNDLLCTGDEGLIRFRDQNGDGKADGPPETFLKIPTGGEHNAHAIRRGPDGWWYLIAGNTSEIDERYASLATSPVKAPHAGVVLRLPPDLSGGEIFADGIRNAYDFEFGPLGDLFVHDSDGERDMSLPWYLPTRLFQVLPGASLGWITDSWKLPDSFVDAAPVVAETGRASPTGIVCYRHTQFPEKYRGGLFLLDWTFGRIQFTPATRRGETFKAEAEEFLKTTGEFGFAPTDAEVGPDGSLFVCVGGRGTHGTVYRVRYVGEGTATSTAANAVASDWTVPSESASADQQVNFCLRAPQPNSSWSRNRWIPIARRAGATAFLNALMGEERLPLERLRAIEIVTELFGGLPTTALEILATSRSPEVRAHAIWSAGVVTDSAFTGETFVPFLVDIDPRVRLKAVQTLARHPKLATGLVSPLSKLLGDPSRIVRMQVVRLFPAVEPAPMKEIAEAGRKQNWQAAITAALAYTWRQQARNFGVQVYGAEVGRRVLEAKVDPELKREAVRLIQIALGDLGSIEGAAPVFDGYAPPIDLATHERELDALRVSLGKVFPTGDAPLDFELARTIAMLGSSNPETLDKLLAKITAETSPTDDVHYLICAARVSTERGEAASTAIAKALVDLDGKVAKRGWGIDSHWAERIGELYTRHVELDENLAARLVPQAGFGRPAHVLFLAKIPGEDVPKAVAAFAQQMDSNPDYAWNNDAVFTLGFGRSKEYYDRVRQQAHRYDLRMSSLIVLSEAPEEQDRERFALGLDQEPPEVLTACLTGLEKLPEKNDPREIAQLAKLARRLTTEPAHLELRNRAIALLARNTKQEFGDIATAKTQPEQLAIVEKWADWVLKTHPQAAAESLGTKAADLEGLQALLAKTDWAAGDLSRGKKLYIERGCAQCHTGGRGLGPDLAGATGRFSKEDLFIAIHLPNRDISPRYQTLMVETKQGKSYTGLIVYEDTDGVMLRNGTSQTHRIEAGDIESKQALNSSLMPTGLLKDLKPTDLADLYAYLKTIGTQIAAQPADTTKK